MPAIHLSDTSVTPAAMARPDATRPVRLIARELKANEVLPAHQHEWPQLTITGHGTIRITAAGSTWIVPPSRAIWIPPGIEHEVITLETSGLRAVYVHDALAPHPIDTCKVLEVSDFMHALVDALAMSEAGTARETHIMALIIDEARQAASLPLQIRLPADRRLRHLCQALIDDPANGNTLHEWARTIGMSERTLTRAFEQELGMGFSQWRQEMRLAHAIPLIAKGWPLSRVAAELGYTSQSAFTAMFKKAMGRPPTAFIARPERRQASRPEA